ncbi:SPOR domain-containing protein [Sphingomonas sp. LB-2]|uniref:SPOR domain-containing protein n=1 Tax=Sphingomonas caeni TaxID=2984949 RepID=UPI00222F6846|nr:tetratricopeptide repeat protein [Sphingomonas caeni]MCW3847555.1 SPOR domain-containing protein [Sphingomonas caeni]
MASLGGAPAFAQTDPTAATQGAPVPMPPPTNPDADLLASEMRFLTQNPRDLRALLSAAAISTRLGDTSAAMAFYARAEKIDPENPRIMAGRAQVLVRMERPGEALRLFQTAEQRGLPMGEYLVDRGLAYDLLGAPQLAQRDYRAALQRDRDDETVRRLALSLGITGKYDEAMRELDPLLRRSDRAAWRARAFILAMQGDFEGAQRIAQSMMPGNMGAALGPFFRRLPGLSVADKAFAVHFGELSPTPGRRADLQLAPQLPPYVPERGPPPVAAAAVAAPTPPPAPAPARSRRGRRDQPVQVAAVAPVAARPVPRPEEVNPLPPPPQYQAPLVQPLPIATPAPTPPPTPTPTPTPAPVQVAVAAPTPALPTMRRVPGQRGVPATGTGYGLGADVAPEARRPSPPGPARPGEDNGVLDNIVGGITVPPEELAAFEMPDDEPEAPIPVRARPALAPAPAPAPSRAAPATAKPAATPPARRAEPKPPPEPKRFWVQVGIGADERRLPDTWRKLLKQAPAAFRGRSAWWTPLRATNRLLTGPFKTAAEAQAFVNTLGKAGIDAYAFTSDAGQKVNRLEVK